MANRPARVIREYHPLSPANSVVYIDSSGVSLLSPQQISISSVGVKAYGLSSIPSVWTKPFFVVGAGSNLTSAMVAEAVRQSEIAHGERLMVRSSGPRESIDARGTLESAECSPDKIIEQIIVLRQKIEARGMDASDVHWVVQGAAESRLKGHLSNELRVCQHHRDWVAEIEPSAGVRGEYIPIAIRTWRDARRPELDPLVCKYKANYTSSLENVARWAYERLLRVHFEWVWNGSNIYVVQADECINPDDGVDPKKAVQIPKGSFSSEKAGLECFRVAIDGDYRGYRKLKNAFIYQDLDYKIPEFFILDDDAEINHLINDGVCGERLLRDLERLTHRSLVLRTDGIDIPPDKKVMLPRSDELRSVAAASAWLQGYFRETVTGLNLGNKKLCLVAHHFIPATASAWCQATPDGRRVRIESLWGIPEGIYYFAHDVFDVDTVLSVIPNQITPNKKLITKERLRYKGRFIAPNDQGDWVVNSTQTAHCWSRSIRQESWVEEVAWNSRRIAQREGKPVVVMWLIDIPSKVSAHQVMPWYHEDWKDGGLSPKAAPRKKHPSSSDYTIGTSNDWLELQRLCTKNESFERVIVSPIEPDIVRNQDFAKNLAQLAKKHNFVVELSGGILSHAYYLLSSEGCEVECADLYATEDEQIEFNKLVRDKIPDSILDKGESVDIVRLEDEALIEGIKRKVVEEALEVADSKTRQEYIEELADLHEVMAALMSRLDITAEEVTQAQGEKRNRRGGFDDALMLSRTTLPAPISPHLIEGFDTLPNAQRKTIRIIKKPEEIPGHAGDIHVDRRTAVNGAIERQLTVELPIHGFGYRPQRAYFSFETQDGHPHDVIAEIQMERSGADLHCRLRLINAPQQLNLLPADD